MKAFSIQDSAMILIGHPVGTDTWAMSAALELLQRNVLILAKFAKGSGMPLVLTSNAEQYPFQGPLMPELEVIAPQEFASRIKCAGVLNPWEDEAFAGACRATGKRNFVMAGVTTDVCMVGSAISAVEEGFNVQVVSDACGTGQKIAEEMAWRRMERAGVQLNSTKSMIAELVRNWVQIQVRIATELDGELN